MGSLFRACGVDDTAFLKAFKKNGVNLDIKVELDITEIVGGGDLVGSVVSNV